MRRTIAICLLGLATGLGWGCEEGSAPASPTTPAPANSWVNREPQRAQPRLPTQELFIGRHRLKAEIASTTDQIRTGMMFRESMSDDEGMLFVFYQPHRASFWMKNVTVELSVAYLDPEGRILEIHDLVPGEEKPVEAATARVQFALETNRGWFARHEVRPGTLVRTGSGSLKETFFRR